MDAPTPDLVHIDDDLIVIDKPAGLVVHAAPSHRGPTLVDWLGGKAGGGPSERPGIVHRLDKGTSGLMVVARNEATLEHLAAQIRAREVDREYLALVEGTLESGAGTIDAPVGRDRRRRTRMAVGGTAAREAVTNFELVEQLPSTSLVRASLETGRTHQVRVHFAAIGHPVIGDPEYGVGDTLGLRRQFLHAVGLAFTHPTTGEAVSFRSELAVDLSHALSKARGEA